MNKFYLYMLVFILVFVSIAQGSLAAENEVPWKDKWKKYFTDEEIKEYEAYWNKIKDEISVDTSRIQEDRLIFNLPVLRNDLKYKIIGNMEPKDFYDGQGGPNITLKYEHSNIATEITIIHKEKNIILFFKTFIFVDGQMIFTSEDIEEYWNYGRTLDDTLFEKPFPNPFSDIDNHWAKDNILNAAKTGYINGFPDGTFRPDEHMTREQYIKTILEYQRIKNYERYNTGITTQTFQDVPFSRWSHQYIEAAVQLGIIKPEEHPNHTFEPNKPITRAEMIVWEIRSYGSKLEKTVFSENTREKIEGTEKLFSDIEGIKEQYYIEYAAFSGMIEGFGDGTFRPYENATRAQIVTILE